VRLRTGAADIDLATSGNVRLQNGASIYSAGWDRGLSAQLEQELAPATAPTLLRAYDYFGAFLNGGQFAVDGGSVTINAGGDLIADTAPGAVTAWLTRVGSGQINPDVTLYSQSEGYGAVPTHWGVVYNEFRNGVAAFGGGDLRIAVGGNVTNAAMAVPTTGRSVDGVVADTSTGAITFQPSQRTTEILGGGQLELRAGGDLAGGQLLIGRGTARLRTGGDIGSGAAPSLYVGADAAVDWLAGGNVKLAGLQDPTVVPLSASQLTLMRDVFEHQQPGRPGQPVHYTDGSTVRIGALGGDVAFDGAGFGGFLRPASRPSRLAATSMSSPRRWNSSRRLPAPWNCSPATTSPAILPAPPRPASGSRTGTAACCRALTARTSSPALKSRPRCRCTPATRCPTSSSPATAPSSR
jgi:hypothetical protein